MTFLPLLAIVGTAWSVVMVGVIALCVMARKGDEVALAGWADAAPVPAAADPVPDFVATVRDPAETVHREPLHHAPRQRSHDSATR